MWYVVQVRTGAEESMVKQCRERIPGEIMESCFIPYYEEQRHIKNEWITRRSVLFPGYIFVVTKQVERLFAEFRKIEGLTKMVRIGNEIVPLTNEDINFMQEFCGKEMVVGMSMGIIESSRLMVLSGPLRGKEIYITKVDRHKRIAWLEIPIFGRIQRIRAGLEIPHKTV